jgi:hypothetical protein
MLLLKHIQGLHALPELLLFPNTYTSQYLIFT